MSSLKPATLIWEQQRWLVGVPGQSPVTENRTRLNIVSEITAVDLSALMMCACSLTRSVGPKVTSLALLNRHLTRLCFYMCGVMRVKM